MRSPILLIREPTPVFFGFLRQQAAVSRWRGGSAPLVFTHRVPHAFAVKIELAITPRAPRDVNPAQRRGGERFPGACIPCAARVVENTALGPLENHHVTVLFRAPRGVGDAKEAALGHGNIVTTVP